MCRGDKPPNMGEAPYGVSNADRSPHGGYTPWPRHWERTRRGSAYHPTSLEVVDGWGDGVRPAPEATTQGQNASNNRIVILQINAAHAKEVTHEIQLQAVETGIHVATIQEPYVQIDFLPGMGLHVSTVFEKQYHNKKTGATISCFAKEITKLKLTELCEHNVSCVELTGSVSETIVSELLSL
uniref:Uncharacterized protein n=1 Tax=Trichogramma kaykai TaxID=54128 RepID=A0ABD2W6Q2_9HYME